jgi:uncharacterized protein YecE (DUF72 family)
MSSCISPPRPEAGAGLRAVPPMTPAASSDGAIMAGTGAWNDQGLIASQRFYPPDVASPLGRLRHYAGRFPLAELDGAFHLLPTVRDSLQLCGHTPESFVFDVRAFRLLTDHATGPGALPNDIRDALGIIDREHLRYNELPEELREELWQRFLLGIEPLRRAAKLGAVILHFPISFVPSAANFDRLALYAEKLKGYTVALEFSHRAWSDEGRLDRILAFERRHGFVHVIADEPDRPASAHASHWAATNPGLAIVRAHGPNRSAHEADRLHASGPVPDPAYSEDELNVLAACTRLLARQAKSIHVLFSNNHADCAQRNAAQLGLVLSWLDA